MLKRSQSYLLKCFVKIFNNVLTTGKFPEIWAKGFIVPLHKIGSKDYPSNFKKHHDRKLCRKTLFKNTQ